MNGPLGDETKMNQHLATNVMLISCETGELEEAYKILMLGGVDLRFSGLTRELQPAVWARIRQRVACLFSAGQHRKATKVEAIICRQVVACLFGTGQHRKATKVLARHIIAVNPDVDRERILRRLKFDKEDLLVDWNLNGCKISVLPRSFSALVCTGHLWLNDNELGSLPADFGQLQVGGRLLLNDNQLDSLPEGFENISVGGDLHLYDNQLVEQSCSFPNVRGEVCFEEDDLTLFS